MWRAPGSIRDACTHVHTHEHTTYTPTHTHTHTHILISGQVNWTGRPHRMPKTTTTTTSTGHDDAWREDYQPAGSCTKSKFWVGRLDGVVLHVNDKRDHVETTCMRTHTHTSMLCAIVRICEYRHTRSHVLGERNAASATHRKPRGANFTTHNRARNARARPVHICSHNFSVSLARSMLLCCWWCWWWVCWWSWPWWWWLRARPSCIVHTQFANHVIYAHMVCIFVGAHARDVCVCV